MYQNIFPNLHNRDDGQLQGSHQGHQFQHLLATHPDRDQAESSDSSSQSFPLPMSSLEHGYYQTFSTLSSSFESGMGTMPAGSQLVPLEQYRVLQSRFNELRQEHGNLMRECIRLETKQATLLEAYDSLLERLSSMPTKSRTVPERADYPNIWYWFRHEFNSAMADDKVTSLDDAPVKDTVCEEGEEDIDYELEECDEQTTKGKQGKKRSSKGENVTMHFVEFADGTVIDGFRATEIRRHARAVFVGFALKGSVFSSWVEGVDAASRISFYTEMVDRFPEIGLCNLDWKADCIAADLYYHWQQRWLARQGDSTKSDQSSKRRSEGPSKASQKKLKKLDSRTELPTTNFSPATTHATLDQNFAHAGPADSIPQINVVPSTPLRLPSVVGQVSASSHLSTTILPAITPTEPLNVFNNRPLYQFPLNKPYPLASSTLATPIIFPATVPPQNTFQNQSNGEHGENSHKPKQKNKMRANKHSTTPRNLCAVEWIAKNHRTTDEFAAYFDSLPEEELERFKKLSQSRQTNNA